MKNACLYFVKEFVANRTSSRMVWLDAFYNATAMEWQDHQFQRINVTFEDHNGTCLALDTNSSKFVAEPCSKQFLTFCEGKPGNVNYLNLMDRFKNWPTSIHVNDICTLKNLPVPEPKYETGTTTCCGAMKNPSLINYDNIVKQSDNNCEIIVHRIWEIQDSCGNRIQSQPQTINYSINISLFSFVVNDVVIDCESELDNVPGPTMLNSTCDINLVKFTHTDTRSETDSSKIIRTWSISNCSESHWTGTQIIQISMSYKN